jgi:hypothetical protein
MADEQPDSAVAALALLAGLSVAELEAQRRALLGDQRSIEQLDGAELGRFALICGALRSKLPAEKRAKPGRAAAKPLRKSDDMVADL